MSRTTCYRLGALAASKLAFHHAPCTSTKKGGEYHGNTWLGALADICISLHCITKSIIVIFLSPPPLPLTCPLKDWFCYNDQSLYT